MKVAFVAPPVPAVPLSQLQREYYFYLFAYRALTVFEHLDEKDFSRFWMLEPVHLGLLQLIAFLESHDIECSFFASISPKGREAQREEKLLEKVMQRAGEFDMIGFSAITASYNTAARMAAAVKKAHPNIPLALGGAHAWARDREILETSVFDFIVKKEGELTTLDLVKAIESNGDFEKIPGLSFRKDGQIVSGPERPRMDRTILSIPDYSHLEDNFTPEELDPEPRIQIPISRVTPTTGCTNNCIWCADYWKHSVSNQRLDRFAEEIIYLTQNRDTRFFYFGTHDFFHNVDQALEIADVVGNLGQGIVWEAQTRVNPKVTRDMLRRLVDNGCVCLHLGIESGNQDILNRMGKGYKLDDAVKMLEMAREEGIHTHTYWLVGSPFETYESANMTIDTMGQWLAEDLSSCSEINLLVGYPGTRFYEKKEKYNITWTEPDFTNYDGRNAPAYETATLTRRDLEYLYHKALDTYCSTMAKKIGTHDDVMKKLGKRFPNFDPAFMEAAF